MFNKFSEFSIVQRIFSHIPPDQFARYLVVGMFNTVFGYLTFALFTLAISRHYPRYGYIIAGLISSVLNISVAFLGYKWFIFKTKGNYLREWLRCMAVYSGGIAMGTVLLPAVVFLIRYISPVDKKAPYLAAAILSVLTVIYSFLGNKKFSFKPTQPDPPAPLTL